MSTKGFIELLRLSKRGNKSQLHQKNEAHRWSGVAFEIMGQYFIAPLGEVSEVIYPPQYTAVPKVSNWSNGIANIRGKLLTLTDLSHFITGQQSTFQPTQKVICIQHAEQYIGVTVDRVLGIQHFNKKSYFSENNDLDQMLKQYCAGYFKHHQQVWNIFMFSRLLNDQAYMKGV